MTVIFLRMGMSPIRLKGKRQISRRILLCGLVDQPVQNSKDLCLRKGDGHRGRYHQPVSGLLYVLKNSRPVLMIRMGPLFKAMRLRQPAEDCLCVRSEVLKRALSYHLADRSSRTSSDNGGAWI